MAIRFNTSAFTEDQLNHLDEITAAATELIKLLSVRPAYLSNENLASATEDEYPIHPIDLVVMVADHIRDLDKNVFLPTHIETETVEGFEVDLVSDTYSVPIYVKK